MPSPETAAAIESLLNGLDYAALAPIYCDSGGKAFWDEHRGPVLELGLRWARAAAQRLAPGGRSLYVGAGVAELPVMLVEVLDLARHCTATNLRSDECEIVGRALRAAQLGARLRLQCIDAADAAAEGAYDHAAVVNVLDDPETFPVVSELTYGRLPPCRLDTAAFERERAAVRSLVAAVCGGLTLPAIVTTTFEEAPWILERAGELGWRAEADETMVPSALVGDPIGFLRLRAAATA